MAKPAEKRAAVVVCGLWPSDRRQQRTGARQPKFRLLRLFGFEPVLIMTDMDGTILHGTEAQQRESWKHAVSRHVAASVEVQMVAGCAGTALLVRQQTHIDEVFDRSEFRRLMVGLFEILQEAKALPAGVETPDQLDVYLSSGRAQFMIECFEGGVTSIMPGSVEFLKTARERGKRIGLYTNSDSVLGKAVLNSKHVFGPEFVARQARLRGALLFCDDPDLGRAYFKPHPYGWALLAHRMGLIKAKPERDLSNITKDEFAVLSQAIILEDRANVLVEALKAGLAGGGVLIAPLEREREAALKYLEGYEGPPIVIVPNLKVFEVV